MKMVPLSESEFAFEKCAGKITFQIDKSGQVNSAKLLLAAAGERTGKKKKSDPSKKAKEKPANDDSAK